MTCPKCGKENNQDTQFCEHCGFSKNERAWFSISEEEKQYIKTEFNSTYKKNPGINACQWILSIVFMILLIITIATGLINNSGLNDVSSTTIIFAIASTMSFIAILVIEIVSRVSRSNNFTTWLKIEKNIIK